MSQEDAKQRLLQFAQLIQSALGGAGGSSGLGFGVTDSRDTNIRYVFANAQHPEFVLYEIETVNNQKAPKAILVNDQYANTLSGRLVDMYYGAREHKGKKQRKTRLTFDISPNHTHSDLVVLEFGRDTNLAHSFLLSAYNLSISDIQTGIISLVFTQSGQEEKVVFANVKLNGVNVERADIGGGKWKDYDFSEVDEEVYKNIKEANGLKTNDELMAESKALFQQLGWSDQQCRQFMVDHYEGKPRAELSDFKLGQLVEVLKGKLKGGNSTSTEERVPNEF